MAKTQEQVPGLYIAYAATTTADMQQQTIDHHEFIARTDEDAAAEARRRCRNARIVSVRRECDADVI